MVTCFATIVLIAFIILATAPVQLPAWISSGFAYGTQFSRQYSVDATQFSGATQRTVTLNAGIAAVTIDEMTDNRLIDANFQYYGENNQPTVEQDEANNAVNLSIVNTQGASFFNQIPQMHVTIGRPALLTNLNLSVSSGKVAVNLDKIRLGKIVMTAGTGGGTITVPKALGLNVIYKTGSGEVRVNGTALHGNGAYTTSGYDAASSKVTLELTVDTGSITVTQQ